MSIGLFDSDWHAAGSGQNYGCSLAATLQGKYDVTLLSSQAVQIAGLERAYGLDLSRCRIRTVTLPVFAEQGTSAGDSVVAVGSNAFDAVAEVSRSFDIFVIVNQLPLVKPLSPFSVFICHFPETPRGRYFSVDDYSCILVSSEYAAKWIKRRWELEPDFLIHAPVHMPAAAVPKENIIVCSVPDQGGDPALRELAGAFEQLWNSENGLLLGWRLVLAGGSPQSPSLAEMRELAGKVRAPVEVCAELSDAEMGNLYARAKIFWCACRRDPEDLYRPPTFGWETAAAMQHGCVPVVIDSAGQREIVEPGVSGFRVRVMDELWTQTKRLAACPGLLEKMQSAAVERGMRFSRQRFAQSVLNLFDSVAGEYGTAWLPEPQEIMRKQRRPNPFFSMVARRNMPV